MVIDDNKTAGSTIKEILSDRGASVEAVQEGLLGFLMMKKALSQDGPFDLAIIDEDMADIDGLTLKGMVEKDERFLHTRIVTLKPPGEQGDSIYRITKPVKSSKLLLAVESALSHRRQETSSIGLIKTPPLDKKIRGKVLVAEDSKTNQRVVMALLKKMGVEAHFVEDGREALRALEKEPYDLILMDLQMPVMDGLEATWYIRKLPPSSPNHQIPIVALTACAMEEDRDRCMAAGMDDYLSKPITPDSLRKALSKWLPEKPTWDRCSFLNRLMDDRETARDICHSFLMDVPLRIDEIKDLLDRGNGKEASIKAHGIKGAAASVDGLSMRDVAYEVERAALEDLKKARSLVDDLEREFKRLKATMIENS